MLQSKDLMIGDWVLAEGKLTRVTDIDEYDGINRRWICGCEDGGCILWDDIKPIPLTLEILEKNGFEKYPYKNSYWYCGEMLELFVKIVCMFPIKDRELRSSLPAPTPRLTAGEDDVYIRCDYVHELQHAMRLCGIEKEIVL